jgi:hypothetical protein
MTAVVAPVLLYLAKEIHSTLHEGVSHLSVFARKWTPVVSVNVGTARVFLTFSPTA